MTRLLKSIDLEFRVFWKTGMLDHVTHGHNGHDIYWNRNQKLYVICISMRLPCDGVARIPGVAADG